MNTPFFFQSPTPVLFHSVGSTLYHAQNSKNAGLSAGQLLDVELGLFLLSQLLPTASPGALPTLISDTGLSCPDRPTWTPKQHRYLNRGRAVLAHCLQPATWNALIERYATGVNSLSAYDVSRDRSWFGEKRVGFSRNRLTVFRKMLA